MDHRFKSLLLIIFFYGARHNLSSCVSSGHDAPIDELVDFIVASHIAEETEKDVVWTNHCHEEKNEVGNLWTKLFYLFR